MPSVSEEFSKLLHGYLYGYQKNPDKSLAVHRNSVYGTLRQLNHNQSIFRYLLAILKIRNSNAELGKARRVSLLDNDEFFKFLINGYFSEQSTMIRSLFDAGDNQGSLKKIELLISECRERKELNKEQIFKFKEFKRLLQKEIFNKLEGYATKFHAHKYLPAKISDDYRACFNDFSEANEVLKECYKLIREMFPSLADIPLNKLYGSDTIKYWNSPLFSDEEIMQAYAETFSKEEGFLRDLEFMDKHSLFKEIEI